MSSQSRRTSRVAHSHLSFLPLLTALCLSAGCFAHAPAEPEENPSPPESPSDGLPDSKMAFLGVTPEQWEARARRECEQDPAGNGCSKLFERAADRLRWNIGSEDAPGLLVHACAQGHRLSCAAVDLLKGATLDHVEELARLACRRRLRSNECYGAASLFAHSCNQKRQAASCLALADFFMLAEPQRPHWASRYQMLACAYGGFCGPEEEEETHAAGEP